MDPEEQLGEIVCHELYIIDLDTTSFKNNFFPAPSPLITSNSCYFHSRIRMGDLIYLTAKTLQFINNFASIRNTITRFLQNRSL